MLSGRNGWNESFKTEEKMNITGDELQGTGMVAGEKHKTNGNRVLTTLLEGFGQPSGIVLIPDNKKSQHMVRLRDRGEG